MARKSKTAVSINRGLFSDIYDECCSNDAERMILDVIITQFLLKEVFKGDQATERAVAKITGLSKSGVRVVEGKAMAKMKDMLNKQGIHKVEDVIDIDHGRSAADGGGSVDEKENVTEASGAKTVEFLANFIQTSGPYAGFSSVFINASSFAQAVKKLKKFFSKNKNAFDGTIAGIIVHNQQMPQELADKLNADGMNDEEGTAQEAAYEESSKLGKMYAVAGAFNIDDMLEAATDADYCAARGADGAWDIATEIEGEY